MYDFNYDREEPNVNDLVLQYEEMRAKGDVYFLERDSFLNIISYYEDQFRFDKALEVIDLAISQHAYTVDFYLRKAQLLLEEDQLEYAANVLEKAKLYEPNNLDLLLIEVELLQLSDRLEEALSLLDYLLTFASEGDLEDIYLLEASVHESLEDYISAFLSLAKVLKYNPFNEMAYSRLWLCMELTEAYEDGIRIHQEVLDRAPYSYWAWYNLGHAYMQLELYEKAAEAYDYTIVINERFEFAYRDIITCYFRLEDFAMVQRYVEDYKLFFELSAEVLLWEGESYEYSGDYAAARKLYHEGLKLGSLDGQIYYRMGVTYANEDRWKQALKAFEQAFVQNKDNEEFCIALAEVYNQLDEVDLSHSFFIRATQVSPEKLITWMSYLEFLIDEENYSSAFDTLSDARLHSNHYLYDFVEVSLLFLTGARKEGRVLLLETLVDFPQKAHKVFEIAPDLEDDLEIQQLIVSFSEE